MPLAAVMTAPNKPIEVQDLPAATVEPGGILLETIYSEVCGTDVHLHHGHLAGVPYPIIPGHVSVGRVVETGGAVTDIDGRPINVGDTVTFLDVHETCHNCWYCLVAKASTRCPHRKVYGITYSANEGLLGGWSQNIYLKPKVKTILLPEGVPPERLIAGGCGLPTAIHTIERAAIQLGDMVAVQGSGPVGLNAAILALLSGAGGVMVLGDPPNRLATAQAFGVDEVIGVGETTAAERVEKVRALTNGRGADVTIEATGVPSAVREGMQMTRDGGRYVIVGQYTDAGEININPHLDINRKHLEIRGCWGSDFSHFYRMVNVLARHGGRVNWERMISREYKLDEMNAALDDVAAGRVVKAVVRPNG
ncbi:MAG: zinc-binding dehydrogenase [Chloroflexi bacterium]|nr:zinc-binding dehydrogenase [Chloroflexota bacterium]